MIHAAKIDKSARLQRVDRFLSDGLWHSTREIVEGAFVMAPSHNRDDISGKKFGRWTVLCVGTPGTKHIRIKWLCRCDCGNEKQVPSNSLKTGKSLSCGCLAKELNRKRMDKGRKNHIRAYRTWAAMISRCLNKSNDDYKHYGGRGITVCERWRSFDNFLEDMGDRPDGKEIDREDNSKGYSPGNCRWVSHKVNSRNTRKCRYVEFDGLRLPISEWAEKTGISQDAIRGRLNRGGNIKEALDPTTYRKRRSGNK